MDVLPHVGEAVLDVVEIAGQHVRQHADEVFHEFPNRVNNVRPHRLEHIAHELPSGDNHTVDDDLEHLAE